MSPPPVKKSRKARHKKCAKGTPKEKPTRSTESLTPEELEKFQEEKRLKRRRRPQMTSEQRQRKGERQREYNQRKRAEVNAAELEKIQEKKRAKARERYAIRKANAPTADMLEKKEKRRSQRQDYYQRNNELRKERAKLYRERKRAALEALTPEEQEEKRRQAQAYHREWRQKKKDEKGRSYTGRPRTEQEEEDKKSKLRFYNFMRRAQMTPEEKLKESEFRKNYQKNYYLNLTGEKKERYKESVRRASRKQYYTKEKSVKYYERASGYQKRRLLNETPEHRQQRLFKSKVRDAKKKLRKQLEERGAPEVEIEWRIESLVEEMKAQPLPPLSSLSQYVPKQRKKKTALREQLERKERGLPYNLANVQKYPVHTQSTTVERRRVDKATGYEQCPDLPGELLDYEDDYTDDVGYHDEHNPNDDESPETDNDHVASITETPSGSNFSVEVQPIVTSPQRFSFQADLADPHPGIQIRDSLPSPQSPPTPKFPCSKCQAPFHTKDDLVSHLFLLHSVKCWKCPKCSEVMLNSQEFSEHFKMHKGSQSSKNSEMTGETSSSKAPPVKAETISVVASVIKTGLKFNCFRCNQNFERLASLTEHVKIKHPASYWPCVHCQLLKYSESSLQFHLKMCLTVRRSMKKAYSC